MTLMNTTWTYRHDNRTVHAGVLPTDTRGMKHRIFDGYTSVDRADGRGWIAAAQAVREAFDRVTERPQYVNVALADPYAGVWTIGNCIRLASLPDVAPPCDFVSAAVLIAALLPYIAQYAISAHLSNANVYLNTPFIYDSDGLAFATIRVVNEMITEVIIS